MHSVCRGSSGICRRGLRVVVPSLVVLGSRSGSWGIALGVPLGVSLGIGLWLWLMDPGLYHLALGVGVGWGHPSIRVGGGRRLGDHCRYGSAVVTLN